MFTDLQTWPWPCTAEGGGLALLVSANVVDGLVPFDEAASVMRLSLELGERLPSFLRGAVLS